MNDPIMAPAHYTVYPVQPIEITRYLGFCLGNATKYALRAPYKGGVEDCLKAIRYLDMEKAIPQPGITVSAYMPCSVAIQKLLIFFYDSVGDELWNDIAIQSSSFIENLNIYLSQPSKKILEDMKFTVSELRRVISLRDTTGQIYEGMTGLPEINPGSKARARLNGAILQSIPLSAVRIVALDAKIAMPSGLRRVFPKISVQQKDMREWLRIIAGLER